MDRILDELFVGLMLYRILVFKLFKQKRRIVDKIMKLETLLQLLTFNCEILINASNIFIRDRY